MACHYGQELKTPPETLPSGYAACCIYTICVALPVAFPRGEKVAVRPTEGALFSQPLSALRSRFPERIVCSQSAHLVRLHNGMAKNHDRASFSCLPWLFQVRLEAIKSRKKGL